jgi:hypothetical protein
MVSFDVLRPIKLKERRQITTVPETFLRATGCYSSDVMTTQSEAFVVDRTCFLPLPHPVRCKHADCVELHLLSLVSMEGRNENK